jgi:hypothetical protein
LMRLVRDELIRHVGGSPSFTQRLLIERAVILSLRVAQIDKRILAGEALTTHDSNYALAWNNSLRRTLVALGLGPTAAPGKTLDQHLADLADDDDEEAA